MLQKKKILIVDDNEEFRKILGAFLEIQNEKFLIFEAGTEASAVKMARREKPDVVLLELQLPKMNGIVTSKIIKEVSPNSIVIIVSMYDTEVFQKEFLGRHIDDSIGKSELDSKLVAVLRKHLRGRKGSGSLPEKKEKRSDEKHQHVRLPNHDNKRFRSF